MATSEYNDRLKRLETLKKEGIIPYAERFEKTHSLAQAAGAKPGQVVRTAGRLLSIRTMGKIAFAHALDASGKLQFVFKSDELGKDGFKQLTNLLDTGDFVGVTGEVFVTQKGEQSVLVKQYQLLSKALRPLPEKWHGLKDQEVAYRQRYLDLIANRETFDRFTLRSTIIRALREFYWQEGFLEIETPSLMHHATGATATPYQTHNNAFDIDLYLRISHELPMKELMVGGFEKIFELGKAFRNEGYDPSHLPEHTHLEHYAAYWNFEDNITFTEKMFAHIFKTAKLDLKMTVINRDGEAKQVNWQTPWQRLDFVELLKEKTGIDVMQYTEPKSLLKEIKKQNISFEGMAQMSLVGLVDNVYKKVVRPTLVDPVILYHYPKYLQPLARVNDADENFVDQFQLVVNGWEIVKAYSELIDPIDQKNRFDQQLKAKKAGEAEVMEVDDEYITAMEHGMPPMSGFGLGVDRLMAILTQQTNLRDVVFFPLMRPEK